MISKRSSLSSGSPPEKRRSVVPINSSSSKRLKNREVESRSSLGASACHCQRLHILQRMLQRLVGSTWTIFGPQNKWSVFSLSPLSTFCQYGASDLIGVLTRFKAFSTASLGVSAYLKAIF